MIKIILLILIGEIWAMYGQVLFKRSVNSLEAPHFKTLDSYVGFARKMLMMPAVWAGFAFIGIGVVIWLTALAQTDLSIAFPIDSMQYIITLVFARIFLGEKIDKMKFWGTLLVIAGIILVAMS